MGLDITFSKVKTEEVGYFGKVNFLVSYFEIRGYDIENRKPVKVYKDDILELANRCKLVLSNHLLADEILPTMSGFFFGSTNYDENYFQDVEEVLEHCTDTLLPEFEKLEDNEYITFKIWY